MDLSTDYAPTNMECGQGGLAASSQRSAASCRSSSSCVAAGRGEKRPGRSVPDVLPAEANLPKRQCGKEEPVMYQHALPNLESVSSVPAVLHDTANRWMERFADSSVCWSFKADVPSASWHPGCSSVEDEKEKIKRFVDSLTATSTLDHEQKALFVSCGSGSCFPGSRGTSWVWQE